MYNDSSDRQTPSSLCLCSVPVCTTCVGSPLKSSVRMVGEGRGGDALKRSALGHIEIGGNALAAPCTDPPDRGLPRRQATSPCRRRFLNTHHLMPQIFWTFEIQFPISKNGTLIKLNLNRPAPL